NNASAASPDSAPPTTTPPSTPSHHQPHPIPYSASTADSATNSAKPAAPSDSPARSFHPHPTPKLHNTRQPSAPHSSAGLRTTSEAKHSATGRHSKRPAPQRAT